jgi:leader peptidase (prepilin peptidase)/N-methyltransferase
VSQAELAAARKPPGAEGRLLRSPASLSPFVLVVVALAFATLPLDRAVVAAFAGSTLVVLSAIDIQRGIIPNRIVLPAAAIVLVVQLALFPGQASEWAFAALLAALALMVPQLLGRSWMGMGDVKLALLLGATLGWGVLDAVLISFLCTFPVAVLVMVRGGVAARKTTIPFGPFLALGALIVLFGSHLSDLAG